MKFTGCFHFLKLLCCFGWIRSLQAMFHSCRSTNMATTLHQLIHNVASEFGDKLATVIPPANAEHADVVVSYGSLQKKIEECRQKFAQYGVKPHDVISSVLVNNLEFVVSFLATTNAKGKCIWTKIVKNWINLSQKYTNQKPFGMRRIRRMTHNFFAQQLQPRWIRLTKKMSSNSTSKTLRPKWS